MMIYLLFWESRATKTVLLRTLVLPDQPLQKIPFVLGMVVDKSKEWLVLLDFSSTGREIQEAKLEWHLVSTSNYIFH